MDIFMNIWKGWSDNKNNMKNTDKNVAAIFGQISGNFSTSIYDCIVELQKSLLESEIQLS